MSEAEADGRVRKKLQRRERILDASLELLREEHGPNVTVEQIARRAGVVPATVFNLVGTRDQIWAALAERVIGGIDVSPVPETDPQGHARKVVDRLMRELIADAPVYRALIGGWSQSARLMPRNPAHVVLEAMRVAAAEGLIDPQADLKRLSVHVGTAINGAMHQWAAGVIGDRALRTRCRDAIDITFAAAHPSDVSGDDKSLVRQPKSSLRRKS